MTKLEKCSSCGSNNTQDNSSERCGYMECLDCKHQWDEWAIA